MEVWPPDMDIYEVLRRALGDVSGLYIGDYDVEYITEESSGIRSMRIKSSSLTRSSTQEAFETNTIPSSTLSNTVRKR